MNGKESEEKERKKRKRMKTYLYLINKIKDNWYEFIILNNFNYTYFILYKLTKDIMLWYVLNLLFIIMLTYLSKGRRKRKTHNTFENYIDEIDSEWKEQATSMLQQASCGRTLDEIKEEKGDKKED